MSIYVKLTLLCLSLVLFSIITMSFFGDRYIKNLFREEIVSLITRQTEEMSADIGRLISSRLKEIRIMSKNLAPRSTSINSEEFIQNLRQLNDLNSLYYSLSFFDMNRIKRADSKKDSIGMQDLDSLYGKALDTADYAVAISKSESVGQVVMHFASEVNHEITEDPVGVLVGRVLINDIFDVAGNFLLEAGATKKLEIHLVNDQGLILYSNMNPQDMLVKKHAEFDWLNKLKDAETNFVELDRMLYCISNVGYRNWSLVLNISNETIFAPLNRFRPYMLHVTSWVAGGSIILALIVAHLFVRPIVRLSDAVREIGEGNLAVVIPRESKDEVGVIATQFSKTLQILIGRMEQEKKMSKALLNQKEEIETKHSHLERITKQLTNSISYAKRIQNSTLPALSTLQKVFPESFVMYKPKEAIGGDFYWFESVRQGNNEYMVIVCADCTGHSVAGAIMSIMGCNQLTSIIYHQNYTDSRKIISRLDRAIKFELQSGHEEGMSSQEGMEIGVCVINLNTLRMEFSGAGIPLRLLKNGSDEMTLYKSPRLMAGGIEGNDAEKMYAEQLKKEVIQLELGDKIYMSSDGYQDQFGGENDKKFMRKNFHALLEDSAKNSMSEQKNILEKTFSKWIMDSLQTDDVIVLGFEIQ